MIIVQFALAGVRQLRLHGRPATLNVCYGKWDNCFATCMVCWRTQQWDFLDADKTPHPYSLSANNPGTPQLGCCGCVICNECLTEEFARRPNNSVIACPYCAELGSYSLDVKAWILCTGQLARILTKMDYFLARWCSGLSNDSLATSSLVNKIAP
jgi:hypothetical protein